MATNQLWTQGPAGSSGGLSANPFYGTGPGQMGPAQQPQYGYGTAPGQGQYGYYQQDTPAGAFAAANTQQAQGAMQQPTMYGQAHTASNPYIGQSSQGIGGQQSVMPYAQQVADQGRQANPWLGQSSQQAAGSGPNAYGGGNPYLQQNIDSTLGDITKQFSTVAQPAMAAAQRASGSFGNSALQELQGNAYGDLAKELGRVSSGMRMQDYTQQQQLAENALNRNQQNSQFNAGLSSGDLGRNMAGAYQGQSMGMQGLNSLLNAGQFDAGLGQRTNEFNAGMNQADLGRNAGLAQSMGQFNAQQQQGAGFNNAQMGNGANQAWAQLGQQNNQFNTGQANGMNQFNTGAANNMLTQQRNLNQQNNQFDQNMDFQTWQANNTNMRQGTQDQIALLGTLIGMNQAGVNQAGTVQNAALDYWQRFLSGSTQAGGQGGTGTNSQTQQGNPVLGAVGGWQLGGNLYNQGGKP